MRRHELTDEQFEKIKNFLPGQNWQSLLELQAIFQSPTTLDTVKKLIKHEKFDFRNPNKVAALIGAFSRNFPCFHAASGEGYSFLADAIISIDAINPRSSAKLVNAFSAWSRFDKNRVYLMKVELLRIQKHPGISNDVTELVSKILGVESPYNKKKAPTNVSLPNEVHVQLASSLFKKSDSSRPTVKVRPSTHGVSTALISRLTSKL